MAYISHGTDHKDLIERLKSRGILRSQKVEDAMLKVDRKYFISQNPYEDKPQKIGFGATISAPHMHVFALEVLQDHLQNGSKVLDIGSGSGYLTACFGTVVYPNGKVIGVEHIPELVTLGQENIEKSNPELIESGVVQNFVGDGRLGYPSEAPYDAIHVGAAAESVPEELTDQLKPGGCLIVLQGQFDMQKFVRVVKHSDGSLKEKELMSVRYYVPLTSVEGQMTGRPARSPKGYKGKGSINMLVDEILLHIFSYFSLREWLLFEMVNRKWNQLIRKQWKSLKSVSLSSVTGTRFGPDVPLKMIAGLQEMDYLHVASIFMGFVPLKMIAGLAERDYLHVASYFLRNLYNILGLAGLDRSCSVKRPLLDICLYSKNDYTVLVTKHDTHIAVYIPIYETHELRFSCRAVVAMSLYYTSVLISKRVIFPPKKPMSWELSRKAAVMCIYYYSKMPNLVKLSLKFCCMINGQCLLAASQDLQSLDLELCSGINTETLCLVFDHLVNLQEISLESCDTIGGQFLEHLPSSIRSVDFSLCEHLTSELVLHFLKEHTELQTLRFADLQCLNDPMLFEIAKEPYNCSYL